MNRTRKLDELRQKAKKELHIKMNINKDKDQIEDPEKLKLREINIQYLKEGFDKFFEEKEILGEGCMGLVRRVIKLENNQQYACKMVKTNDEETIKNVINEFKNCRKLDHSNIVKVYELYIDENHAKIYTIMELVKAREMFDVIQKLGGYSEDIASRIFKQILSSIHYLHEMLICHRDLKPNNILASEDGMLVKITDFNVSKFGENKRKKMQENIKMWTYTGTVAFSAPEIF
jgi:serine/threonine protein kinase